MKTGDSVKLDEVSVSSHVSCTDKSVTEMIER